MYSFIFRVKLSHPSEFFERIESVSDKLNIWAEELYLELHQGTFTTNAEVHVAFSDGCSFLVWVKTTFVFSTALESPCTQQ